MSEFDFNRESKEEYTPDSSAENTAAENGERKESDFEAAAKAVENGFAASAEFEEKAEAPSKKEYEEKKPQGEYTYAFRGDQLSGSSYDPRSKAEDSPRGGVYGNPSNYVPYNRESYGEKSENSAHQAGYGTPNYGERSYGSYGQHTPYGQQGAYTQQDPHGQQGAYNQQRPYVGNYGSPYSAQRNINGYAPENETVFRAEKKPKKEKKKGGMKTSSAILLCVACLLLSLASGMLGSVIIYNGAGGLGGYELSEGETENGAVAGVTKDGAVILYRSVETVKEDGSEMTIAEVANTVSDSVVEITTEFVTTDNFFFGQYVSEGAGSGVIITENGYIITNNHVISDTSSGDTANKIKVRLRSGEEYEAEVIGKDADSDVAILKIEAENLKAAVWGDSEKLVVGQQVVAVGNPLGELGGTVTTGIISASDREVQIDNVVMTLIQIDAAVNPGNSGGGLFNTKGELIGIVNAKSSGSGIEGLGFAIPSNEAQDITTQLLEYGYVKGKVYIGVSFYEANSGYYSSSGEDGILYVYATEKGYNDDVLQSKDIVLSIDGEEVSTTAEVKAILKKHKVGDTLTFSILRNKTPMEVTVTCYEAKPLGSKVNFGD